MRKLIIAVLVLISLDSFAQPTNYTWYKQRIRQYSLMLDSMLYIPRYNGTPSGVRANENSAIDGAIAVDTANGRQYFYYNGSWRRLANYSELGVDSIWRVAGIDSIFWSKAGNTYKIKDSVGGGTNIYNSDGTLSGARVVSFGGNKLTFQGQGYGTTGDTLSVKNNWLLLDSGWFRQRVYDAGGASNNYGHYQIDHVFSGIQFRHFGPYKSGCGTCGSNTMEFRWYQNASYPSGGTDTLLNALGAHNGPDDHHFFLADLTNTYSNANRYVTVEHNGNPFVGFYNNPVGNFPQSLFGSSLSYTTVPNWENWHTIIGGKFAVTDTAHFSGKVRASGLNTGKKSKQLFFDPSTNMISYDDTTGTGGGGGSPGGANKKIQYNSSGSFAGAGNMTREMGATEYLQLEEQSFSYGNDPLLKIRASYGLIGLKLEGFASHTPVIQLTDAGGYDYRIGGLNDGSFNFFEMGSYSSRINLGVYGGTKRFSVQARADAPSGNSVEIFSGTAGSTGLVITGASGQTANLLEIKNSTPSNLAVITATGSFDLYNGTAPTSSVTNGIRLYSEDVTASAELKVRDEAGNITTLSPHNFGKIPGGRSEKLAWSFYSQRNGEYITADMTKALRTIENQSSEIEELKRQVAELKGLIYEMKAPVKLIHTGKVK